ncbi:MAG: hypothetical protein AB7F31_01980 [Parachlamydiales bacterium]
MRLLLTLLLFPLVLFAERPDWCKPQRFYASFESAYLSRDRAGGSWQEGILFGGHIGWDRVKFKGFYWGIDAYYLTGTLMGQASSGCYAESAMQVNEVEGRLGWTFCLPWRWSPTVTPFVGYGYYHESNRFHANCPWQVRFRAYYDDLVLGFLSSVNPCSTYSIGLNIKVGLIRQGHNRISEDPMANPVSQRTGDRPQYTVELPLTLYPCRKCRCLEIAVVPFYRLRHFGGRENYPFDFFETRLSFYGARAELGIRW